MKLFILIFTIIFSYSIPICFAAPMGDYKVMGKVKSYDKKWMTVEVGKKKVVLPRRVVKEKNIKTNVERELLLSQLEFNFLRSQYFGAKKKK